MDGFTYRCDGCGQGWKIGRTDDFNRMEPRFCPVCGHAGSIRRTTSILAIDEAKVFIEADIKPRLIQLLYQVWRGNVEKVENLPDRFVDYLTEQLDS